jgi:GNAT superfamily N-acetyltransferase
MMPSIVTPASIRRRHVSCRSTKIDRFIMTDRSLALTITITQATPLDAPVVASLILDLTGEICDRLGDPSQFDNDLPKTTALCARWIEQGIYTVLLAHGEGDAGPIGVAAIAESHALYAEGKIGIIQECYVTPAWRNRAVGGALVEAAIRLAPTKGWACMELCTPPLPEFAKSLDFYRKHAFKPVGGRKMRLRCA